jgi:hypothetical protein
MLLGFNKVLSVSNSLRGWREEAHIPGEFDRISSPKSMVLLVDLQ